MNRSMLSNQAITKTEKIKQLFIIIKDIKKITELVGCSISLPFAVLSKSKSETLLAQLVYKKSELPNITEFTRTVLNINFL